MALAITPLVAPLYFLKKLDKYKTEKPFEVFLQSPPPANHTQELSNCEFEKCHVVLANARNTSICIHRTGFEYLKDPLESDLNVTNLEQIQAYAERMMAVVKSHLHAETVILFDWRYREGKPPSLECIEESNVRRSLDRTVALTPAQVVHIDDSPVGGARKLECILTADEMRDLQAKKQRARFINVWRSLSPLVGNYPLVLCDKSSAADDDFRPCDRVLEHTVREESYFTHNPQQRWYWLPDQTNEEVWVFVTWDSTDKGPATGCPHGAVNLTSVGGNSFPRRSIELRMLVITDA